MHNNRYVLVKGEKCGKCLPSPQQKQIFRTEGKLIDGLDSGLAVVAASIQRQLCDLKSI